MIGSSNFSERERAAPIDYAMFNCATSSNGEPASRPQPWRFFFQTDFAVQ
jgi:hypothetical protein